MRRSAALAALFARPPPCARGGAPAAPRGRRGPRCGRRPPAGLLGAARTPALRDRGAAHPAGPAADRRRLGARPPRASATSTRGSAPRSTPSPPAGARRPRCRARARTAAARSRPLRGAPALRPARGAPARARPRAPRRSGRARRGERGLARRSVQPSEEGCHPVGVEALEPALAQVLARDPAQVAVSAASDARHQRLEGRSPFLGSRRDGDAPAVAESFAKGLELVGAALVRAGGVIPSVAWSSTASTACTRGGSVSRTGSQSAAAAAAFERTRAPSRPSPSPGPGSRRHPTAGAPSPRLRGRASARRSHARAARPARSHRPRRAAAEAVTPQKAKTPQRPRWAPPVRDRRPAAQLVASHTCAAACPSSMFPRGPGRPSAQADGLPVVEPVERADVVLDLGHRLSRSARRTSAAPRRRRATRAGAAGTGRRPPRAPRPRARRDGQMGDGDDARARSAATGRAARRCPTRSRRGGCVLQRVATEPSVSRTRMRLQQLLVTKRRTMNACPPSAHGSHTKSAWPPLKDQ